jgi:hypothetical protein
VAKQFAMRNIGITNNEGQKRTNQVQWYISHTITYRQVLLYNNEAPLVNELQFSEQLSVNVLYRPFVCYLYIWH